jgi:hypothetical protein
MHTAEKNIHDLPPDLWQKQIKDIQYYGKKRKEQKYKQWSTKHKTELKIEQNELHKKPKVNLDAAEG